MLTEVIRNPPSDETALFEDIVSSEETVVSESKRFESKRFYTHCIVSYASIEELKPLLELTKHYAMIYHDVIDHTSKNPHYHILATFEREKSFSWVRKQVVSEQNTFTKPIFGDVDDVITYFQHADDESKKEGKTPYSFDKIIFDDPDYWRKRIKSGDKEENHNDMFVDDLISDNYSVQNMARKYGRDFLKNLKHYEYARERMLLEVGDIERVYQMRLEQRRLEEAIVLFSAVNNND